MNKMIPLDLDGTLLRNGKTVRKATRCYVLNKNEILAIKYKEKNLKAGYYDIPRR